MSGYFGQFCFSREDSANATLKEPFKPWGRLWKGFTELRADFANQAR